MRAWLESCFGPDGALSESIDDFEPRAGQAQMAVAIHEALSDPVGSSVPLLIEAGAGLGKTLAYLIPAILSGKRVVISTRAKNLQDQILNKDIPIAARAVGADPVALSMKGRANYLCLRRYEAFERRGRFDDPAIAAQFKEIARWERETESGDRDELGSMPDDSPIWGEINSRSELCLAKNCPHYQACHFMGLKRRAAGADILLVNHHLFFADLALRSGSDHGAALPPYDAAIFDEAHHIEDIAGEYFGLSLSSALFDSIARDIVGELTRLKIFNEESAELIESARAAMSFFFESARSDQRERLALTESDKRELAARSTGALAKIGELKEYMDGLGERSRTTDGLADRIDALASRVESYVKFDRVEQVYWARSGARATFLQSTPLDVGACLAGSALSEGIPLVFVSATMTIDGAFGHIADRLGLVDRAELSIESPYDYASQARLYIGDDMPVPSSRAYPNALARRVMELIARADGGGVFVLFTSARMMRETAAALEGKLDYHILTQGDAPRSELLDRFRRGSKMALFGTSSFWEGVDARGAALTMVIIDKLPFASPSDPVISARIARMKERGVDPFMSYQVPAAALALKQGVGRLIRSSTDYGLVAILDSRLARAGYGKIFLRTLGELGARAEPLSNGVDAIEFPTEPARSKVGRET